MDRLEAQLHQQLEKSVALIQVRPAKQTSAGQGSLEAALIFGTIVVLKPNFIYLVAKALPFRERPGGRVTILFPDGKQLYFRQPVIHLGEHVAGICCPSAQGYDTALMRAVPLSPSEIAVSQSIHVFSQPIKVLTSGTVMGICDEKFQHNCCALDCTALGSPAIDDHGYLAGICYDFRDDYLESLSTRAVASDIERAQGRNFTSIDRMVLNLQNGL